MTRRAWTSNRSSRRRLVAAAPLFAAWLGIMTACSLDEPAHQSVSVSALPPLTTTTDVPSTSAAPPQPITKPSGVALPVYFVRSGQLGVAIRNFPPDVNVVRHAVDALLGGPTKAEAAAGLSTAVPSLTRVRSMRLDAGNVVMIDLTGSFGALGPANSAVLRLAQIVYTVTIFPVTVRFLLDGQPAKAIGGYILPNRPLTRDDFAALAPSFLLESIGPGEIIEPGKDVSGTTTTARLQIAVRLTDATGHVLFHGQAESASGKSTWHPFRTAVTYKTSAPGPGVVTVSELSPPFGRKPLVVAVPVLLG